MKANPKLSRSVILVFISILLFSACSSIPVDIDDIPVIPNATEMTITKELILEGDVLYWLMVDGAFVKGPYQGFHLAKSATGHSSIKVYSVNIDAVDILKFYQVELSEKGWKLDNIFSESTEKGKIASKCFAWTRGNQVFLVILNDKGYMTTYLLNK